MELTQLPAEMMVKIAMGMDSPIAIAAEFGFTSDEFLKMSTQPWFFKQIDDTKQRLEAEGFTFKNKMAALAEDLLIDAYQHARRSVDVSAKLDVAKYISKVAGLEPVTGQAVGAGGGFSLVINIPPSHGHGGAPQTITVDATPTTTTTTANTDQIEDLSEAPTQNLIALPTMQVNGELSYDDAGSV